MREQWYVGVMFKYEEKEGMWSNAYKWYKDRPKGASYVKTKEEAKKVLENAYRIWNGEKQYDSNGERREVNEIGASGLGVSVVCTKETDDDMRIVRHMIKRRYVTDWEVMEEA